MMAASHGIRTVGVIGAGQMGLGIAYVSAVKAQVPRVLLCDASSSQLSKGVAFFESLLAKDVKKGKIKQDEADAARARLSTIEGVQQFGAKEQGEGKTPEMVIEVSRCGCVPNIALSIFKRPTSKTLTSSTIERATLRNPRPLPRTCP